MSRILVLAPQFIGDSILAIPFLRELKKHCGRVEIDIISKNAGCKIFSACPYIANIYDYKKINFSELRKNNYSKAYVLKRSLSAAIIAFLSGSKERIGFGGQGREILLTRVVKYNKNEQKHELEHFMDILREDYVEITDTKLEYYVNDGADKTIQKYLNDKKKVLFVACSSTPVKDWSCESFAKVAEWFSDKDYCIYFVGLESEVDYCNDIISLANDVSFKNLCGKLTFEEVIALVNKMDCVFGVDSGFCHVAAAFDKKVVTLFGPTPVYQWKPLCASSEIISADLGCSPCKKPKKCQNNYACMKNISSETVISRLEKVL